MKKFLSFFLSILIIVSMFTVPTLATETSFTDVTEKTVTATSYKAISWVVDKGIVKGYSDGTFKPRRCAHASNSP